MKSRKIRAQIYRDKCANDKKLEINSKELEWKKKAQQLGCSVRVAKAVRAVN